MDRPPSLLLITWNRPEYARKTLDRLLANPEPFRLFCWDNGSAPETAELVRGLKDERIVDKQLNPENVGQGPPVRWLLDRAGDGGLAGKVDDDVLLPDGWLGRLAAVHAAGPGVGMVGCWVYMPDDYLPDVAAQNVVDHGGHKVLRTTSLAGTSFLADLGVLRRYYRADPKKWGLPVDRTRMTLDGLVNGYALPLVHCHHMDDPRSEHCLMRRDGAGSPEASLTARKLGFAGLDEYARWIRADALRRQVVPFAEQLEVTRRNHFRATRLGRALDWVERRAYRYL